MTTAVLQVPFLRIVKSKYKRYGLHVLGFRHFAEGRDGMTPVHRRSVWTLGHELNAVDHAHIVMTARAGGEVFGKYHPHEIESVFGAMTTLSQAKSAAPLIMGVGNWGSWDEDPAAARYTSCFLSKYAMTMFDRDELRCVPYDDSFDGNYKEPRFLPARLPHLLLQGSSSWGVAAKGDIPPCDPAWVVGAIQSIIRGKPVRAPRQFVYRWGGRLVSLDSTWLKTGHGSGSFLPAMRISDNPKSIVITSLAPRLNIDSLVAHLEGNVESYGGMVSEPTQDDLVSISILLRKDHNFDDLKKAVANQVKTRVDYTFLYIEQIDGAGGEVDFKPRVVGPLVFLKEWVEWRRGVVCGAAHVRIADLQADTHKQQLMLRVIEHRDALLNAIDRLQGDTLKRRVCAILKCSAEDAEVVLEIRLRKLAKLEVASLRAKIVENNKRVKENQAIVRAPDGKLMADAISTQAALAEALREANALNAINEVGKRPRRKKKG